jgi:hypothetical protein
MRCQSGAYGHRGPFGDAVLRPSGEPGGRTSDQAEAELNGARLHGGLSQDLFHVTVQLGDDRRRRALAHENPEPGRFLSQGDALLPEGRDIGQGLRALRTRHCQRPHSAGLDIAEMAPSVASQTEVRPATMSVTAGATDV